MALKTSACEASITCVHLLVANVSYRIKPEVTRVCRGLVGRGPVERGIKYFEQTKKFEQII